MVSKTEIVIVSLNHPTMVDMAWDEAFGQKVHPHIRAVFDAWHYLSTTEQPTMTDLSEKVAVAIERDLQTGKKAVKRAKDLKYITIVKDKEDGRKRNVFLVPEAQGKYERVVLLKRDILGVIEEQLADLQNPIAGTGLVPDSVYTNLVPDSIYTKVEKS